jgi:antitoxin (DNA-binding transcriptional repressor) of toxin-antitoxin stability system
MARFVGAEWAASRSARPARPAHERASGRLNPLRMRRRPVTEDLMPLAAQYDLEPVSRCDRSGLTHLSRLIAEVEAGEEVVLARGGKPVVRLVRLGDAPAARRFGAMRGRARTGDAFFEPLPEAELDAWD